MHKKSLFDEFQEVSSKAWKQKIQYDLKGADYNEELVWESPEGIKVKPFYHRDDLIEADHSTLQFATSWKLAQRIFVLHAASANKKAKHLLKNGVESLIFTISSEKIKIEELLSGLHRDSLNLHFQFQFLSVSYIERLRDYLVGSNISYHLNIDPIGNLSRTGNWFSNNYEDLKRLEEILSLTQGQDNLTILSIDLSLYQNAGANMVQQLAYALAHGNEYLNRYSVHLSKPPVFKVAVGSNYFFEIAKIRALRRLWQVLAKEYGIDQNCHILVSPSKRNKTLYGYNTNMLRTTTECMCAILGGADTVCNLPYDHMFHRDNEFAERIARNQLLVLKNESHFDAIEDPTKGSYYIETLTEQLSEKALQLFKNIEIKGGFLQQLKNHTIQRKIKESAQKEQQKFDLGQEVLVGTNSYETSLDQMKNALELYPFLKMNQRKTAIEPIIEMRLAERNEKRRLILEGWQGN